MDGCTRRTAVNASEKLILAVILTEENCKDIVAGSASKIVQVYVEFH
jgi:hypothetical protein